MYESLLSFRNTNFIVNIMRFNNNSQRILSFFYEGRPVKAKETVAVDFENSVKEINSVSWQNKGLFKGNLSGAHSNHML